MAYTKKTNTEEKTVKTTTEKTTSKTVEPVKVKEYKSDDLIPCRSMTKGELIYVGKKSALISLYVSFISETKYLTLFLSEGIILPK